MIQTIKHQFFFSDSPEYVWEYLTNPQLMELWLMPNNFTPALGHEFQFKTKPIQSLDLDDIFYCQVLEMVPYKKLVYSWKGGPGDGSITLDTKVDWTLEAKENGTQLSLSHSGFKEVENYNIFLGMTDGWSKNIKKIDQLLNKSNEISAKL